MIVPSPFSGTAAAADEAARSSASARRICVKIQELRRSSIFVSCRSVMARAPETGFYFEPVAERLALVLEGALFRPGGEGAHVGIPVEMRPGLRRLEVATRGPGGDPAAM